MVQYPAREISTTIMATPGSGPIPYCRRIFAPAMNVSPAYTGTLLACTSELTIDPAIDSSTESGSKLITGAMAPTMSIARSSRLLVICERMFLIRTSGSCSPIGAARLTPAKRFPPAGSASDRRLTGTAIGNASMGTPLASW